MSPVTPPGPRRLGALFAAAGAAGRTLTIPYLTYGFPHQDETVELVLAAEEGGADIVELGLPFSDPLADGPTIQASSQRALEGGASLTGVLEASAAIRRRSSIPLVYMGYYNPIQHFGLEAFVEAMAQAGVDGLIVPDLPLEEAGPLAAAIRERNLSLVSLIAPTTPEARVARLDEASSDFSYCVAVTGVTGARTELDDTLPEYLARVKRAARKPFVVGFGISTRAQVARVAPPAAGVVVGSALIAAIDAAPDAGARRAAVRRFVSRIAGRSTEGAP